MSSPMLKVSRIQESCPGRCGRKACSGIPQGSSHSCFDAGHRLRDCSIGRQVQQRHTAPCRQVKIKHTVQLTLGCHFRFFQLDVRIL